MTGLGDETAIVVIGDFVLLKDLTKAGHLNGRQGVVASDPSQDGRLSVNLFLPSKEGSERKEVAVKPENVRKITKTQAPPKPGMGTVSECDNCSKLFSELALQECSRCKLVAYCGKNCQLQHWKMEHKKECEAFRQDRKTAGATNSDLKGNKEVEVVLRVSSRLTFRGKYTAAEKILRDGIEELLPAKSFKMDSMLAKALACQDRTDEACGVMQEALRVFEAIFKVGSYSTDERNEYGHFLYHNFELLLEQQGNYEQAIKICQKVLQFRPTAIDPLWKMGRMHYSRGCLDKAEEAYRKFLQAAGNHTRSLTPKSLEQVMAAYSVICDAIECRIQQTFSEALSSHSVPVDYIQQQSKEAITLLQKSLLLDPTTEERAKEKIAKFQKFIDDAESMR